MAIAYVRDTGHITGNNVDSAAGSFSVLPAAGNSIIVPVAVWAEDVAAGEVSDNQGNTYVQDIWDPNISGNNSSAGIHSDCEIGSPSGTFTVTINPGGTPDFFEGTAYEFSGLADASTLDITAHNRGNTNAPAVTGGTTNQADELWVGVLGLVGASVDWGIDLPATWNQMGNIIQDGSATTAFMAAYLIKSATGTLTFNGGTLVAAPNGTDEGWAICAAAYKGSVSVGPALMGQACL